MTATRGLNQAIIDSGLSSDHRMVVSAEAGIISFNVLTKCRAREGDNYGNNAVGSPNGITESPEQYTARLHAVIKDIVAQAGKGITAIALQEAPRIPAHQWFYDELKQELQAKCSSAAWSVSGTANASGAFQSVILTCQPKAHVVSNADIPALARRKSNPIIVNIVNSDAGIYVSCHLSGAQARSNEIIAEQLGKVFDQIDACRGTSPLPIYIMGDFNKDLSDFFKDAGDPHVQRIQARLNELGLKLCPPSSDTYQTAKLDFMLVPSTVRAENCAVVTTSCVDLTSLAATAAAATAAAVQPKPGLLGSEEDAIDIEVWPGGITRAAERFLPDTTGTHQITIGDLHGNALKLLYMLVRHGVLDVNQEDYGKFVEIYKKGAASLTREDIENITRIVNSAVVLSKPMIRLIGDELADRGSNDYFTLLLLKKLHEDDVPFEALFSNHGAEFLAAYEGGGDFSDSLGVGQARSAENLQVIIGNGLVTRDAVDKMVADCYKPHFHALGYTLRRGEGDKETIIIHSHAPIGIGLIECIADKLGVPYRDDTAHDLAQTIDRVNAAFAFFVEHKAVNHLFTVENREVVATTADGARNIDPRSNPFGFLTWNRNHDLSREGEHRGYAVEYVHGHDSTSPSRANISNLDNQLGKGASNSRGIYTVHYQLSAAVPRSVETPSIVDMKGQIVAAIHTQFESLQKAERASLLEMYKKLVAECAVDTSPHKEGVQRAIAGIEGAPGLIAWLLEGENFAKTAAVIDWSKAKEKGEGFFPALTAPSRKLCSFMSALDEVRKIEGSVPPPAVKAEVENADATTVEAQRLEAQRLVELEKRQREKQEKERQEKAVAQTEAAQLTSDARVKIHINHKDLDGEQGVIAKLRKLHKNYMTYEKLKDKLPEDSHSPITLIKLIEYYREYKPALEQYRTRPRLSGAKSFLETVAELDAENKSIFVAYVPLNHVHALRDGDVAAFVQQLQTDKAVVVAPTAASSPVFVSRLPENATVGFTLALQRKPLGGAAPTVTVGWVVERNADRVVTTAYKPLGVELAGERRSITGSTTRETFPSVEYIKWALVMLENYKSIKGHYPTVIRGGWDKDCVEAVAWICAAKHHTIANRTNYHFPDIKPDRVGMDQFRELLGKSKDSTAELGDDDSLKAFRAKSEVKEEVFSSLPRPMGS